MANLSMRGSKLKASEAALLAGELTKPSWQSKNEGIHERVSFEDSIWGFDLAGGLYYKTPLRVTAVKKDSRAEKAGIRPGDKLLRINDIDTSTLTIQEAHEIIIESGIHIRLAVSAPEDTEDSYNCYQDPIEEQLEAERLKKEEEEARKRKRKIHYKINENWSLMWPWVSKRKVIYRESNCFMVPSKYESRHRDKFPLPTWGPKQQDDIVLHSKKSETPTTEKKEPNFNESVSTAENKNEIQSPKNEVPPDNVAERFKSDETNKSETTNGENGASEQTPMDLEIDNNNGIIENGIETNHTNGNEANDAREDHELENWDPNLNEESKEQVSDKDTADNEEVEDELIEEEANEEETNEEEDNKIIDEILREEDLDTE